MRKRVLSIAGSDPSGGAGVQADLKTATALRCYGMAVLTALTAQNTVGVSGVHLVPAAFVGQQLDALFDDCPPDAIKIGMLGDADVVAVVAEWLAGHRARRAAPLVLDPVMLSTSGHRLASDRAVEELAARLFPLADLVTPNRAEARLLTGVDVVDVDTAERAAAAIVARGARAVLVKGGDVPGNVCADVLFERGAASSVVFRGERVGLDATHGTGCTLSTAIACGLAQGEGLRAAIERAKAFVEAGLREATPVGKGAVPIDHVAAGEALR